LRVDQYLILLDHAAEAIDVRHSRHALQAFEDLPVLQALQVDDVNGRIITVDPVAHDFPGRIGVPG